MLQRANEKTKFEQSVLECVNIISLYIKSIHREFAARASKGRQINKGIANARAEGEKERSGKKVFNNISK